MRKYPSRPGLPTTSVRVIDSRGTFGQATLHSEPFTPSQLNAWYQADLDAQWPPDICDKADAARRQKIVMQVGPTGVTFSKRPDPSLLTGLFKDGGWLRCAEPPFRTASEFRVYMGKEPGRFDEPWYWPTPQSGNNLHHHARDYVLKALAFTGLTADDVAAYGRHDNSFAAGSFPTSKTESSIRDYINRTVPAGRARLLVQLPPYAPGAYPAGEMGFGYVDVVNTSGIGLGLKLLSFGAFDGRPTTTGDPDAAFPISKLCADPAYLGYSGNITYAEFRTPSGFPISSTDSGFAALAPLSEEGGSNRIGIVTIRGYRIGWPEFVDASLALGDTQISTVTGSGSTLRVASGIRQVIWPGSNYVSISRAQSALDGVDGAVEQAHLERAEQLEKAIVRTAFLSRTRSVPPDPFSLTATAQIAADADDSVGDEVMIEADEENGLPAQTFAEVSSRVAGTQFLSWSTISLNRKLQNAEDTELTLEELGYSGDEQLGVVIRADVRPEYEGALADITPEDFDYRLYVAPYSEIAATPLYATEFLQERPTFLDMVQAVRASHVYNNDELLYNFVRFDSDDPALTTKRQAVGNYILSQAEAELAAGGFGDGYEYSASDASREFDEALVFGPIVDLDQITANEFAAQCMVQFGQSRSELNAIAAAGVAQGRLSFQAFHDEQP